MKKLVILSVILLGLVLNTSAQEKPSKFIVEKVAGMKAQITEDLELTSEEANTYARILTEKYITDAAKVKELTTEEEKKAYYAGAFKTFMTALKKAFGNEKAQEIQQWTRDNQAKFNKPKD